MSIVWKGALTLVLATFLTGVAAQPAQPDAAWKRQLSQDLVAIKDGKMVFEEHNLCKLPGGAAQFQILLYSEAPAAGIVSRDSFVALTSAMFTTVLLAQATAGNDASDAVDLPNCKVLESPIGKVDFELKVTMTNDGFQVEFLDKGANTSTTSTSSWAEVYPE